MNQETTFRIQYKGITITGSAYVDGQDAEITELDIDALDLLGICDNNSLTTITQLIVEDWHEQEYERASDRIAGY